MNVDVRRKRSAFLNCSLPKVGHVEWNERFWFKRAFSEVQQSFEKLKQLILEGSLVLSESPQRKLDRRSIGLC